MPVLPLVRIDYKSAMDFKGHTSSFAFGMLSDSPEGAAGRIAALYAILAAANIGAWVWALIAFRDYPLQLGTAFLAYTLGLRHAVDVDHIAAIDNVTRKLMQEGKRPATTGFFFLAWALHRRVARDHYHCCRSGGFQG
jgi:high-affinity nickel-transport protein